MDENLTKKDLKELTGFLSSKFDLIDLRFNKTDLRFNDIENEFFVLNKRIGRIENTLDAFIGRLTTLEDEFLIFKTQK